MKKKKKLNSGLIVLMIFLVLCVLGIVAYLICTNLLSKNSKYKNGTPVYFNVTTGKQCDNYIESQSATGTKTGCMKFYAFNDEEGKDTLNLILDHNTTALIVWNSSGSNELGPNELLTQLKEDTKKWKGTIVSENYTMNQIGQPSNANYTIKYKDEGYKARLITAQEVAEIVGNTGWDERTAAGDDWYYFDSKTKKPFETCKSGNTSGCQYAWLYDRTAGCTLYGCNVTDSSVYGYWTSSSDISDTHYAWSVDMVGVVSTSVDHTGYSGIRPVITIDKSKLK